MMMSPRRIIVDRLIRHFRAKEYEDSWTGRIKISVRLAKQTHLVHQIASFSHAEIKDAACVRKTWG